MPSSLATSRRAAVFTHFVPYTAALTPLLLCAGSALAQTITVTTLNDVVDFASPQQVANLPGPDGKVSFREACLAASNTPGVQTIEFAIPQSEWWLVSTMAILRLEQGVFVITGSTGGKHGDGTILDFTTQTNFTGKTNPNGNEVGIYGLQPNGWGSPAIVLNADNVLVKGLGNVWQRGNAVSIRGNNNKVQGCVVSSTIHAAIEIGGNYGGSPASNNLIGGTNEGEGNILSGGSAGVRIINPATDNIVVGNTLAGGSYGVWIIGNQYTGYVYNNRVGGPTPEERNIIRDAGGYCCEGAPSGGQVMIEWAVDTIIENNYIGVTADGMSGSGQIGPVGIGLRRAPGTVLRDNVIADIIAVGVNHHAGDLFGVAIDVTSESDDVIIQGNKIGVGADGVTPIPNLRGISVSPWIPATETPNNVLIGGVGEGEGNIIAHTMQTGVRITGAGVNGITVRGNSIHSNGLLGIDLDALGVTPNDNFDADTGPNGKQNFPVLSSAETNGSTLNVAGTLHSKPNASFWIDIYANEEPDASGHGEGEVFIGSGEVTTNGSGNAAFDFTFGANVPPGWFISATATEQSTGNTSEFALSIVAEAGEPTPGTPGDLNGDGSVGVPDLLILLGAWGPCAECDSCPADLNDDCTVGVADLLILLGNWG